jgi:hypothetical protein
MHGRNDAPVVPGRAWLRIDAVDLPFAEAVVADIGIIRDTPSGRALFRQVSASGRSVRIEPPGKTNPPNAWVRPAELDSATASKPTGENTGNEVAVLRAGTGTDAVIAYRPADWPNPAVRAPHPSDVVLFALLQQARGVTCGEAGPPPDHDALPDVFATPEIMQYCNERRA